MKYVLILWVLIVAQLVDSKPYQFLEPRPGYVPVYIRLGDQPLSEINPSLANAFREHDSISSYTKNEPEINLASTLPSEIENEIFSESQTEIPKNSK